MIDKVCFKKEHILWLIHVQMIDITCSKVDTCSNDWKGAPYEYVLLERCTI